METVDALKQLNTFIYGIVIFCLTILPEYITHVMFSMSIK